jgi:hypothetical protein
MPTTKCPKCGGFFVIHNLHCLDCYGGTIEGQNCGTDGCPAFGIATENRCRCTPPCPDVPAIDWDDPDHTLYTCDSCGTPLSSEGQGEARRRNPSLLLCNDCNHGKGEFIDDVNGGLP